MLANSLSVQPSFAGTCCNSPPTKSSPARVSSSNSSLMSSVALRRYVLLQLSSDLLSSDTYNCCCFYIETCFAARSPASEQTKDWAVWVCAALWWPAEGSRLISSFCIKRWDMWLKLFMNAERHHKSRRLILPSDDSLSDYCWALQGLVTFNTDRQEEGELMKICFYLKKYFTASTDTDAFLFASIVQRLGCIQMHISK